MLKSKAAEILRTFTNEELKSFRNYTISPFHNTNRNVIKLLEISRKFAPEYNSPWLQKENLFKKLYPGKKYSDIVMRILLSDLLRLAEEFLAYTGYSKEPLAEKKFLLNELTERKLDSLHNKHIKESEQMINTGKNIDELYFRNCFDIENEKINFLISKDKQMDSWEELRQKGEYLVDFFLINAMNVTSELWEHEEVFNAKIGFNLAEEFLKTTDLEKVLALMKENGNKHYEVLEIYYYMYMSLKEIEDDKYYKMFKDSFVKKMENFSYDEQYNMLLALESCCVTKLRHGRTRSTEDLMEVYELMLSSDIFTRSSRIHMQANLFRNIFYTAVRLKKYRWAEDFIDKHRNYLVPDQREDMYNYTTAHLSLERKNYDTALEHISKVNYSFFVFKFDAKILMIKIYYELRSFEQALSLIDSFSHFLMNNKNVSKIFREPFLSFLKIVKSLIKSSNQNAANSGFDSAELIKKVEGTKQIINRGWILEKAAELQNRK